MCLVCDKTNVTTYFKMSRQMEKKIFISGKKLFQHRKAAKMSQEDIADKIGASRQTINIWEKREEIELTPDQAGKLTKVLKVSIDDLTSDQTPEKPVMKDKPSQYDAGNMYRQFFEEQTDYLVIPRVMFEDYEIVPKAEQEAKRQMFLASIEQHQDYVNMLKKNLEDLRRAIELGRGLRKQNVQ
jgi:DNA-binding XRE family transcriptional regulator